MYGSVEEVRRLFEKAGRKELTDDDAEANIIRGDHLIDGFLHGFFTVPFTTVPDLIVDISNLFGTAFSIRQKYPSQQKSILQYANSYEKEAWKLLRMVKRGELYLDSANPRLITALFTSSTIDDDVKFETDTEH